MYICECRVKRINTVACPTYEDVIRVIGYDASFPCKRRRGRLSAKGIKWNGVLRFRSRWEVTIHCRAEWRNGEISCSDWYVTRPFGFHEDEWEMLGEAFIKCLVPCLGTSDHEVHEYGERDA